MSFPTLRFRRTRLRAAGWLLVSLALFSTVPARAQRGQSIDLTLESAVEMAMENSYRVRQLRLGIERTRHLLRAERAELKSRVEMRIAAPEFAAISDYKWDSDLQRDVLVRENSRLWQADFSIRQPVIFFGYPTNGYLSLNNRVYRYTQLNGGRDVTYYNRYFIAYEQPFFQPNRLKNELEEAELDLEDEELEFQQNVVDMLDDIADAYYDLFQLAYERVIYSDLVSNLERAATAAQALADEDSARALEVRQVQVELANAREQLQQAQSNFRLEASSMKQRLRLTDEDVLQVEPAVDIVPVQVDLEQAIQYGTTLRPRLRELAIQKRMNELNLEQTRGNNSFRVNVEMTYGREMQDPRFAGIWEEPSNSYTVGVNAYLPIWDWGERKQRIQAEQIRLQQTELYIEEEQHEIRANVRNAVQNLEEYQARALNMEQNLSLAREIAEMNLTRYRSGTVDALNLLQSFNRQADTADNLLDAYLGYRQALIQLQELTYYDFEQNIPLLERFRIATTPR